MEDSYWVDRLKKAIKEIEKYFTQILLCGDFNYQNSSSIAILKGDGSGVVNAIINLDQDSLKVEIRFAEWNGHLIAYYVDGGSIVVPIPGEGKDISETLKTIGIDGFLYLFEPLKLKTNDRREIYNKVHSIFDVFISSLVIEDRSRIINLVCPNIEKQVEQKWVFNS
jgi:hypothetical protein